MLTRLSPDLPSHHPVPVAAGGTLEQQVEQVRAELRQAREDHRKLIESLVAWHERLNGDGSLQIADATIDGTPIGASGASTGAFTTLSVSTSSTFPTTSTTPAPTAAAGTFTTVSATLKVTNVGNRRLFTCIVTITTNGTAAGHIIVPMPFTAAEVTAVSGVNASNGLALAALVSGANLLIYKYDATYPGGDGVALQVQGGVAV